MYALFALVGTGLVPVVVWAVRRRLGCMAAMMAAMTTGMVTGLWIGVMVGATADLWRATIIGGGAGLAVGLGTGAAVGPMPALDGALSGLMGGMMGAMLGAMAPHQAGKMLPVATGLVWVSSLGVLAMIARAVGWGRLRNDVAGTLSSKGSAGALLAVLASGTFGLGATGPPSEHSSHLPLPVREMTVVAREYGFDAPPIHLVAGERVRLRLVNAGGQVHHLHITAPGATGTPAGMPRQPQAGPGQTQAVEFTAPAPGVYTGVCTVPGHQQRGMVLAVMVR